MVNRWRYDPKKKCENTIVEFVDNLRRSSIGRRTTTFAHVYVQPWLFYIQKNNSTHFFWLGYFLLKVQDTIYFLFTSNSIHFVILFMFCETYILSIAIWLYKKINVEIEISLSASHHLQIITKLTSRYR